MAIKLTLTVDDKGNVKIDQLGKNVKKVSKTVTKESKKMQSAWSKSANAIKSNVLGLATFTAAMFAVRGAVKTVLEFEDAMAEVSTIVDTNIVNMHKLNSEILDLSTRVPKDAANLAQGLYQTISAGVTDVSDAMIVLESSSKAATAGLTSTFVAVDAGTTIMNAYGKTVQEIDAIQDVLFNTVKEGKTKYDSLATSIGRAAPIAAQVGVSFEELTAAAATLTKGGLSTEEAMTSIRAIMVGILKPTTDAEILAKKLKLQFDSEALAAKGLGGFLEEVTEKTGGNTQAITALFGNVRALTGVMALAGKQADEFKRIIESNTKAAGVMNEAFEKMNETVTAQWQLLKNQFNKTLIELGSIALPGVIEALNTFTGFLSGKATEAVKGFIEQAGFKEWIAGAVLAIDITNEWALATMGSMKGIQEEAKKTQKAFEFIGPQLPEKPDGDGKAGDGGLGIVVELTEQQIILAELKKAILAAERESLLTLMAIRDLQAEGLIQIETQRTTAEGLSEIENVRTGSMDQLADANQGLVDLKLQELDLTDKLVSETATQLLLENQLIVSVAVVKDAMFGMAQNLAQAVIHGESLSKVFSKLINQIATRGLGALFGAGVGFAFGGPAGALAGARIGAGVGGEQGLDMTVPPGFPGDSFPVFATSGERVKITPAGGQRGGGDININPVFHVTGSGLSKSKVMEAARPGIDLIASGVKKAISSRQIMKKDLDKAK